MSFHLHLQNTGCRIDDAQLVQGIDLNLEKGGFYTLIGPNGAGKSTLMRCIAGLQDFTGKIQINGRDLEDLSASERAFTVAYVPQFLEHLPTFTAVEYLRIIRYQHGDSHSPSSEVLYKELLERCAISHLENHLLPTLSGGERQRLMIAGALVQGAPLLLLDEVTAALDPLQEELMIKLLTNVVKEEQLTVLWATHDLNTALQYSDRIIALKGGKLFFDKTSAEATVKMESLFERTFAKVLHPETGRLLLI